MGKNKALILGINLTIKINKIYLYQNIKIFMKVFRSTIELLRYDSNYLNIKIVYIKNTFITLISFANGK